MNDVRLTVIITSTNNISYQTLNKSSEYNTENKVKVVEKIMFLCIESKGHMFTKINMFL